MKRTPGMATSLATVLVFPTPPHAGRRTPEPSEIHDRGMDHGRLFLDAQTVQQRDHGGQQLTGAFDPVAVRSSR